MHDDRTDQHQEARFEPGQAPPGPPPYEPPQRRGVNPWLLGCGVGCGALVLVAVVAVAILYFLVWPRFMSEVGDIARQEVQRQYDRFKDDGRVPGEHEALYDELVEIGASEEASGSAAVAVLTVMMATLEDGEVSEDELAMLTSIRDILVEDPSIGFLEMLQIMAEHPELENQFQEQFEQLQDQMQAEHELEPEEAQPEPGNS